MAETSLVDTRPFFASSKQPNSTVIRRVSAWHRQYSLERELATEDTRRQFDAALFLACARPFALPSKRTINPQILPTRHSLRPSSSTIHLSGSPPFGDWRSRPPKTVLFKGAKTARRDGRKDDGEHNSHLTAWDRMF